MICIDSMEPIEYEDDTASYNSYSSYDYEDRSFQACPLCRSAIENKPMLSQMNTKE